MYVKNNLDYKVVDSPFSDKGLETQAVQITLKKVQYLFINCYFGQTGKDDQILTLKQYLKQQAKTYGRRIICAGDFNVDVLKVGTDTSADYLVDSMSSFYLAPQVQFPTRVLQVGAQTQVSLIDNIFSQT